MTLIGQGKERTRLQQLIDWCEGPEWDGPLIFDEASPLSTCPEQGLIQYRVCCAVKAYGIALGCVCQIVAHLSSSE